MITFCVIIGFPERKHGLDICMSCPKQQPMDAISTEYKLSGIIYENEINICCNFDKYRLCVFILMNKIVEYNYFITIKRHFFS